ncbi:MAG: general secretion pathway protein GspK [Desulfamplus sp.]|nr:general secretion pathway protein GspK [Desulfamplus sp.]
MNNRVSVKLTLYPIKSRSNPILCSNYNIQGSVLVLVLWILVIISFLSSEYVAHNRQKAAIALHTIQMFQRESAAFSVMELFASEQYDFLKIKAQDENADSDTTQNKTNANQNSQDLKLDNADKIANLKNDARNSISNADVPWIRLRPGGVEMWVKIENESSRIQLSLTQENNIRTTLKSIYGEDREQEADSFTDAILDWLDPDDLIRLNGAEKAYYNEAYPPCDPGNSPFKSMSQIFLVKGFRQSIFWADPYEYIMNLPIYDDLKDNYESIRNSKSKTGENKAGNKNRKKQDIDTDSDIIDNGTIRAVLEQFTIYPKETIRISMLFPEDGDRWHNEIFWISKNDNSFKLSEQLSRVMVAHMMQNIN